MLGTCCWPQACFPCLVKDDSVAVARAQAIAAEIWSDIQRGELDASLSRYRPLVEEEESDLIRGLKHLMEIKRQARVTHAYRTVLRYGRSIRTSTEAEGVVVWMQQQGLAASTQSTILSTIRSVQPRKKALQAVRVKVPARRVQEEVPSRHESRRFWRISRRMNDGSIQCLHCG